MISIIYSVNLLLKFDKTRQEMAKVDPVKAFWATDADITEKDPWENRNRKYLTWISTGVGLSVISFYLYGRQEDSFDHVFQFTIICLAFYNVLLLKPSKNTANRAAIPERIKALDKIANLLIGHCAGFAVLSAALFLISLLYLSK
jgi:hypothetical protein